MNRLKGGNIGIPREAFSYGMNPAILQYANINPVPVGDPPDETNIVEGRRIESCK